MADLLYMLLAGAVFCLDRIGKRSSREKYSNRAVNRGPVVMRNLKNRGAVLNLGTHHSRIIRVASVVLTACLTVIYIVTLGHAGKNLLKAGLSLLLGGAFSNTYDRLKDGYVTDYLSFRVGPASLRKVVFNIGDFGIIIGALLIVLGA